MKQKEIRAQQMKEACTKHGVEVNEFNVGSFRLTKEGFRTIDYYPKKGTAFYHGIQEWVDVNDVSSFVAFEFSNKGKKPDVCIVISPNKKRAIEAINNAKDVSVVENNGVVTIICKLI